MKLGKRYIVYVSILVILTVMFAITNQYLVEFLTYLSPRHEVKPHFIGKVRHELFVGYIISVILLFAFAFVLPYFRKYISSEPKFYERFKLNASLLKKTVLVFAGLYIFIAPLFILHSLDISTDESTYAYTGYHYYQFNKFMIKFDNDTYIIPKDMFLQNIPLMVLKPFVPYSLNLMRYISYFYSMLFVVILYLYFKKKHGILYSKVFLISVASYTGFIFLSGTSFGENSALLFALVSIYLFSNYYESNKLVGLHLSALLLSLSIITKIQLGIFVIPALIIFSIVYYLKGKEYKHTLALLLEVFVFSFILVSVLWLTNYSLKEIKSLVAMYYAVSINSVTYAETSVSILMNIERFFNYYILLFLPVVFYYFYSNKYEKSFMEKFFFLVFLMNALWFITMKGYNFRFMYFAQMGIILLSVRPVSLYYAQTTAKARTVIKLLFSVVLILGVLQNIKLTSNGVSNDYLFALNGNDPLKTFYKFNRNDDQKIFYDKVKTIIDVNEPVYYVGAEFEVMAFIQNKFYTFDVTTYNPELNIRYIIRTSINDQIDINLSANEFLNTRCEKVFEKGLYCLYRIK